MLEAHKQAEIDSRTPGFMAQEASKPFGWESAHWVKWATINEILRRLGTPSGAEVLDLGCGPGWTSLFLAEAGHAVTGVDLVPANVELATARARRWGLPVDFEVGDMEDLDLGRSFDLVVVYDALHHCARPSRAVARAAAHLRPGGWIVFGEPSRLHDVSPGARQAHRDLGWRERGVGIRWLRQECAAAGLSDVRRFFQGTEPYESRTREFAWQLVRLVAANVAFAPGAQVWLAARRP